MDGYGEAAEKIAAYDATAKATRTGRRDDLQARYEALLDASRKALRAAGCAKIEVADLASRQRWTAARARHHPGGRPRRGHAQGTRDALRRAQGHTVVCTAPGCGALVHLQSARQQARKDGRQTFVEGDGCASWTCAHSHPQPGRFRKAQRDMAAALRRDKRTLVLWPQMVAARVVLWTVQLDLSRAIAEEAWARYA